MALILVFLRTLTFAEPVETDLAHYLVVAHELLEGELLYSEVWDNKPPGIFIIYALGEILFGYGEVQVFGLNVLFSLLTLLGIFEVAKLGVQLTPGKRPGFGAANWAITFYVLLSSKISIQANQPNTELFINTGCVWGFYFFLRLVSQPTFKTALTIGTLIGLVSLIKQQALLFGAGVGYAFLLVVLAQPSTTRKKLILSRVSVGGILPVLVVWGLTFSWFGLTDRLGILTDTLFTYGRYYAGPLEYNFWRGLTPSRLIPSYFRFSVPLFLFLLPAFVVGLRQGKSQWVLLAGFTAATFASIALPGKFFPHYYQYWIPILSIGLGWATMAYPLKQGPMLGAALVLYLAIIQVSDYRLSPNEISEKKYDQRFYVSIKELSKEIPNWAEPDEKFFVWAIDPGFYFYSKRRPPVGLFWCYTFYEGPLAERFTDRALAAFRREPPKFVIVHDVHCKEKPENQRIYGWLKANYQFAEGNPELGGFSFWTRR
jgi:hypothetical protein